LYEEAVNPESAKDFVRYLGLKRCHDSGSERRAGMAGDWPH
jgi:hypothetical protein